MQDFQIVTCKAATVPLVLQLAKGSLDKIAADPKTKKYQIHTFLLTPAVEMPETNLALVGQHPGQPQMVMYCTIMLIAPGVPMQLASLVDHHIDAVRERAAGGAHYDPELKSLSDDDLAEIEKIKHAKRITCKHEHLQPERLFKGYRGPDNWYQICADCGAEHWNEKLQHHFNQHVVNGKMEFYPNDPLVCVHPFESLDDHIILGYDKGGHPARYKLCNDCGAHVYQGLPTAAETEQMVADKLNGL